MAEQKISRGWASWLAAVAGWLICAFLCLCLTIGLEPYAQAYDMFFPVAILLLFGNILVFLFISSRWGAWPARLAGAVARVCIGEGLLLAGIYALGRYAIGA